MSSNNLGIDLCGLESGARPLPTSKLRDSTSTQAGNMLSFVLPCTSRHWMVWNVIMGDLLNGKIDMELLMKQLASSGLLKAGRQWSQETAP